MGPENFDITHISESQTFASLLQQLHHLFRADGVSDSEFSSDSGKRSVQEDLISPTVPYRLLSSLPHPYLILYFVSQRIKNI